MVRIAPFKFGGNHCFIPFVRSFQPKSSKKLYTCMIVSKYLIPQTGHWLVGREGNLNFLIQSHVEIQEKKKKKCIEEGTLSLSNFQHSIL